MTISTLLLIGFVLTMVYIENTRLFVSICMSNLFLSQKEIMVLPKGISNDLYELKMKELQSEEDRIDSEIHMLESTKETNVVETHNYKELNYNEFIQISRRKFIGSGFGMSLSPHRKTV